MSNDLNNNSSIDSEPLLLKSVLLSINDSSEESESLLLESVLLLYIINKCYVMRIVVLAEESIFIGSETVPAI